MKRNLAILLTVLLSLNMLAGCGNSNENTTEATTTEAAVAETTTQAAEVTTEAQMISNYDKVEIHTPNEFSQTGEPEKGETVAIIHVKDMGDISVKFFYEDSPLAVENFVTLAANGYYDGIIFHRVIADFMIQGGDPTGTGAGGESMWGEDFKNEYSDRLTQINGSLAMARTQNLDTNGSQFFINNGPALTEDYLEYYGVDESLWDAYLENGGNPYLQDQYTVFGQVYDGMDVVAAISAVETDSSDRPVTDIVIESIEITQYEK